MQIHRNIQQIPQFEKAVITIGTFDGVHLGHAQIMHQLVQTAKAISGQSVVITFYPHPRNVVSSDAIQILTTQEEKYQILESLGVDHLVEVPFDKYFAEQSAEDYIRDFLVSNFNPQIIITGYDHRFGKNRAGDYRLLESFGETFNYTVKEIPAEVLEHITISSTIIREALKKGDVKKAADNLGYAYTLSGTVVEGNKMGRTIGYPTANIQPNNAEKLIPANGVYAVKVSLQGEHFYGMMNIGVRPTVNGKHRTIEVNIFDFDRVIYGEKISIQFIERIRDERKFENLDALKQQLKDDETKSRAFINP